MDPHYPSALAFQGFLHLAKNEFPEAMAAMEQCAQVFPHPHWVAHKGLVYGLAGRHEDAARILQELVELARRAYVSPMSFAIVYQGLGDMPRWREMMQACLDERSGLLATMDAPWNDSVRQDPFFAEVRRKVGLPEPGGSR